MKNTLEYFLLDDNETAIPCSIEEWGNFLEDARGTKRRIVKQEYIYDKFISTVFLGLNHNWSSKGTPLIFETMIFNDNNGCEEYCDRYSTWDEALIGHEKAVQWVKDGCKKNE
jgi:hypothetical protein